MKTHLVSIVLLAAACSSHDESEQRRGPEPRADLTGAQPLKMQNCPSGVASASTVATPTPAGVDVTITSSDPRAREQILALTQLQATQGEPYAFAPPHTGTHGGPGSIGRCPIIHAHTLVSYEPIPDGVRIHVMAKSTRDIPQLQQATSERVRALAAPSS